MDKIVSIVMPVYGVEKYISRAIESVINQTYTSWQLIIINDGTKDRSIEIARKYANVDDRIEIHDKSNGGLSDARNFGLNFVKGEYIHFFDSDDYILPDFYKNLVAEIECKKADYLICGYQVISFDQKGCVCGEYSVIPSQCIRMGDAFRASFLGCVQFLDFAWNKFYRSDFLLNNKLFFDKTLYFMEDSEFISRVFAKSLNFWIIREGGYCYCQYPRNSLSKAFTDRTIELCSLRIVACECIASALQITPELSVKYIAKIAFLQYRHILYSITNSATPLKLSYIKKAFNDVRLRSNALKYKSHSIEDFFLRYLIKQKMYRITFLLLKIK